MKTLLVSQRVIENSAYPEIRDALDQRWHDFFEAIDIMPYLVPNNLAMCHTILEQINFDGILLTGGNDLVCVGGKAFMRDKVETCLLERAIEKQIPLLGVCRGMQLVHHYFGGDLKLIDNQVMPVQNILINNTTLREANSYHTYALEAVLPEFKVWAATQDKVIKGIKHNTLPLCGIMWHPERMQPFSNDDIKLFKQHFGLV